MCRSRIAFLAAAISSSLDISSPSRYFIMSSSSASTIDSTRDSLKEATSSAIPEGTSLSEKEPEPSFL